MRPTPVGARRSTGPAGLGAGLLLLVAGIVAAGIAAAGIATAPPAAAVEDLASPDAVVTRGPSCRPGGVDIAVTAGSVPYLVVLATTRTPGGEDSARLAPGQTAVLRTGDVVWGETIDSRLEYTALDGSGEGYVDKLVPYSFTRPSEEDCAAIGSPAPATVPGAAASGTGGAAGTGTVVAEPDRPVRVAAAELPVAPVRSAPVWPPVAAGLVLLGSAGGVVAASGRRWPRSRRGVPISGG